MALAVFVGFYVEVEVDDVENGDGDGKCVNMKDGCRMRLKLESQ